MSVLDNDRSHYLLVVDFSMLLEELNVPGPCYLVEPPTFIGSGAQFNVSKGVIGFFDDGETSSIQGPPLSTVAIKKPKFMLDSQRKFDLSDPNAHRQLREILVEIMALHHPRLRRHPNIVNLVGWGFDNSTWHQPPLIALELAQCDLDRAIRTSLVCDRETTLSIFSDIANGLDAIHEVGLVHGDLKPENVLLFRYDEQWTAKLADFAGGANLTAGDLLAGRGTVGWRAPELRRFHEHGEALDRAIIQAIDTYAYGLMLWAIVCGSADPPPAGESPEALSRFQHDIRERREVLPYALSEALLDLAPTFLSRIPGERPLTLGNSRLFSEAVCRLVLRALNLATTDP